VNFVLKKYSFILLTLILIFVPTIGMAVGVESAVKLEADAQTDIEVQMSSDTEHNLNGNIQTEGILTEEGLYTLSYFIELTNESMTTIEDIQLILSLPADVSIASYSVIDAEAEIAQSGDALLVTLPQLDSEASLTLTLNIILEAEQELEVITTSIAIEIDGDQVFLAELSFRLVLAADATDAEQEEVTEEEGKQEKQDEAEEDILPITGSLIGNWLWVALGLTFIISGLYYYRKFNMTAA
jgi:hypothetical protein